MPRESQELKKKALELWDNNGKKKVEAAAPEIAAKLEAVISPSSLFKWKQAKEFGTVLRALRERRGFSTQEQLAIASGLTKKQVGDLEQWRYSPDPVNHLEPLAQALKLTEAECVEFWAAAGLIYQRKAKGTNKEAIETLLQSFTSHAIVRTKLWDIVAFNMYHYYFWEYYKDGRYQRLKNGDIRPNLLWVLFDPAFKVADYSLSGRVKEDRIRDLCAFRASSLRYLATQPYKEVLDGVKQYKDFDRWWRMAQLQEVNPSGIEIDPTIRIQHPQFGAMKLMSLRVPQEYHGQNVIITVYVPLEGSEDRYQDFRASALRRAKEEKMTRPHFFDIPPYE